MQKILLIATQFVSDLDHCNSDNKIALISATTAIRSLSHCYRCVVRRRRWKIIRRNFT